MPYGRTARRVWLTAVLCACGDAAPPAADHLTVDTLESGAILVQNPDAGAWSEGEAWRLVEELRIGAVDGAGPDVFGDVHSLSFTVDEGGRLYVVDGHADEVRVFDSSGRHLRSFGGTGAGPGELRSPYLAGWGPMGNLWIADAENARYSVFTPEGELLATDRRESTFDMRPWPGTIDTAGRILDVGVRGRSERVILRVDPRSGAADTFPMPEYEGGLFTFRNAAGLPVRSIGIPYAGRLVWKLDGRGYVWSTITDEYRIVKQDLDGDTLRIIELDRPPVPVTREERDRVIEREEEHAEGVVRLDPSLVPSTKPYLLDFMVDDRGGVWVVPLPGRLPYDVFDREGRYLGKVAKPVDLVTWTARPVFRGDHVYGFVLDEMMVPYLVRLRIERGAPP